MTTKTETITETPFENWLTQHGEEAYASGEGAILVLPETHS